MGCRYSSLFDGSAPLIQANLSAKAIGTSLGGFSFSSFAVQVSAHSGLFWAMSVRNLPAVISKVFSRHLNFDTVTFGVFNARD